MSRNDLNGILPVYKERGFTSNDVVAKLRVILHMKKIGHTGTLDPEAEGVLVVCLGRGTKLVNELTDTDKTYSCVCRLGVTTDTEDMTGTVLEKKSPDGIKEDDIKKAAKGFIGEYMQVPPMYSAKKVNGKKLYELARNGEMIERKPCRVFIRELDIKETDIGNDRFSFTVTCSKGTYIRSLCRDIGEDLGCGAAMESLVRTRACGFTIDETYRLSEIEDFCKEETIAQKITGIEEVFSGLEEIRVDKETDSRVINGNILKVDVPDGKYRVYLSDGRFAAVYEARGKRAVLCGYFLT